MENNGNDIFDPIDTDTSTSSSGYVPRFERDLQKMGGNLNALADAKKAEQQAEKAAPVQEQPTEQTEADENDEEIFDNVTETDVSDEPDFSTSPYHSAPVEEDSYEYEDDGYRRGRPLKSLSVKTKSRTGSKPQRRRSSPKQKLTAISKMLKSPRIW